MNIYAEFQDLKHNQRKALAILIDPDRLKPSEVKKTVKKINKAKADYIFVGGSFISHNHFKKIVKKLQKHSDLPVIIFPGSTMQISKKADALLFLSLISGRNPEYLIGKQVEAAPILQQIGLETISTGYILVENGHTTSVEYITNTKPIPRRKTGLALATALAGQMLGHKLIYLEAGSGALESVPLSMIQKIHKHLNIPLIVGGGVKNRQQILEIWNAGADIVVVGTAFENGAF